MYIRSRPPAAAFMMFSPSQKNQQIHCLISLGEPAKDKVCIAKTSKWYAYRSPSFHRSSAYVRNLTVAPNAGRPDAKQLHFQKMMIEFTHASIALEHLSEHLSD